MLVTNNMVSFQRNSQKMANSFENEKLRPCPVIFTTA